VGTIWVKANFHCHSDNSADGEVPVDELCRWYADRGYGLLAVTDHNIITPLQSSPDSPLALVPRSVELGGTRENVLAIGVRDMPPRECPAQEIIDGIRDAGGLAILAHPNWCWNHWSAHDLVRLDGYVGIEIVNTHMRECDGHERALHVYDEALLRGKRLWAFGNDDAHNLRDQRIGGRVWNMILAGSRRVDDVLSAVAAGEFYVSSGTRLRRVTRGSGFLQVTVEDEARITFVVNGERVASHTGREAVHRLRPGERFVRAEVESDAGVAFTQPVYAAPEA